MRRKKVGLALGSGGARGLSHIGVIRCLVENNIPIDFIAGTSIGALIGGAYSYYKDIIKVEEIFNKLNHRDFISAFLDPVITDGIFKGEKAVKFLRKYIGYTKIEELSIPFQAVATDLISGKVYRFRKGDLAEAIRASGSLPFLFKPIKIGEMLLIDGGASEPVPVRTVQRMGADIIIAVNLDSVFFPITKNLKNSKRQNALSTVARTIELFRYHLAAENVLGATVVIEPNVPDSKLFQLIKGENIINKGEEVTIKEIKKIKKLLNS